MFIILVYDVNVKRVSKVHKICRKYLRVVQRSVFEGDITQKQLTNLENELKRILRPLEDGICIYRFDSSRYAHKIQMGSMEEFDNIL